MARVVFTAALFAALAVSAAALSHDHAFIRDPEAALKLDADTVTAELESAVREHYLLKHDYLQCFQNQGFTDMRGAVRIFAENHYTYSKNFIKYLRMVADKVRPELQHLLLENIAEEEGNYEDEDLDTLEAAGVKREWVNKKPHRDLIRRFLNAAEVDQSMFNRTDHPGGRFTSWIIKKYEDANACEALSMIGFAIEETVSILYSYLWNGLKTTDMNPEDFVFFPLHILVDDGHADLLKNGFKAYWRENPEQCKAAPRLVLEVLDRRSVMMDELRDLVDTEFGATCDVPVNPNRPASIAVPTSGFNSEHVFIRDPEAAVALSSKEVVSELERAVREHYLLKHDYLQCFQNQGFTDMRGAVRIFAENHYTYSKNFIKYLRMVADKVRPELQHLLLENIAEEEGNYEDEDLDTLEAAGVKREWVNKKPHRDLIRRFLNAAEVDQSMFNRTDHPGGRFTSWIIKKYQNANACEALSMIGFAIEETVSILYSYLWNGLKTTDMDPEDFVFFPLHILVDDGHADLLKAGFAAYWDENPEQCKAAPRLVLEVLDRRSVMMDELRELVESEFGATCKVPQNPARATQLGAIRRAAALTKGMPQPQWTQVEKMALAARILAGQGHGHTLSGQITCRTDNADGSEVFMWTQAYGTALELIRPSDFVRINSNLEVVEGTGFPNLATRFHLHVYRERPDIKCAVHTHSPWTSALAMTGEPLEIGHMDTMALFGRVAHLPAWPGVPFGNEEGEIISGSLGKDHLAVLAGHHGLFVGGRTIEEATYLAYFFEHAAKMQLRARAAMNGKPFPKVVEPTARRARDWRIMDGPVKAHFNSWARQVIASGQNPLTQTDEEVCAGVTCFGSHA